MTLLYALSFAMGLYVADFPESYIYNLKRSLHVRFHDGQNVSIDLLLDLIALCFV